MDDLISRQSVINAIEKCEHYPLFDTKKIKEGIVDFIGVGIGYLEIKDALEQLPSAQPNLQLTCNQLATDCISRKAAIVQACKQIRDDYIAFDVKEALKALPSAQPEQAVKDCRNCKHGKYNDYHDTYFCYNPENCSNWDKWETSAQPERKKGKWIQETKHYKDDEQEYYYYEEHCSNCGVKRKIGWGDANFCPNCGSYNVGEEHV